jgi:hypothetical protein
MATPTLKAPLIRIRFRNPGVKHLTLWIEPLGDQVEIPQRTTFEVHCTEELGHPNEFEVSDDGITVHGWVQSVHAVSDTGHLRPLWALPE